MNELVAKQGGRMTIIGVITMVFGIMAISTPLLAGKGVALLIGILVLLAGLSRLLWAFRASGGERVFLLVVGVLTTVCGVVMVANPLFTAGVLAILLAIYFIADGIFEIMGAFSLRPERGWGWLFFAGIVSLALGIMIWRQFPLSGLVAVGVLLGIKLFLAGLLMITVGSAARVLGRSMSENG
ncbi:MAG: DUF308 domain-containing protein [Candidatus Krumholzibacteria bacterium]|nr:DUF308 domain-containing protein [Candidatus Krumholzibacteria bacterium]